MDAALRHHADTIVNSAIKAVLPDRAVARALESKYFPGRVVLVAPGKCPEQPQPKACSVAGYPAGKCCTGPVR